MTRLKAQLEIGADVSGVEAGVGKAKRSINSLGVATQEANSKGSKSIDAYVKRLEFQAATTGKTARESEIYKLALKGASDAQLKAADSALKLTEGYQKGLAIGTRLKADLAQAAKGVLLIGAAVGGGLIAAAVAFDKLIEKAASFQDMAEKVGDSAENFASLAVAAAIGGKSMDEVATFSIKLTKNLTGVDDESKAAGAAITKLGLDLSKFKQLRPAEQIEAVAKALAGFDEGQGKTAVLEALAKGGAQLLPVFKELGDGVGRVNILTSEQIKLADDYKDKQAKSRAQLELYAAAVATQAIPTLTALTEALTEVAKEMLGVDKNGRQLSSGNHVQTFARESATFFADVVDSARHAADAVTTVGRSYGAAAAIVAAATRGDFAQVKQIIADARKDGEKLFTSDFSGRLKAKFAQQDAEAANFDNEARRRAGRGTGKATLAFDGKEKKDKDQAGQIAKAQLAFDLEQIKKEAQAAIDTFANAEKIMEAMRAAGLVDEREYYASKLAFLRLNSSEQERELQLEIGRLQRESAAGKDKIDNDRKILDLEAQLKKARAASVAETEILQIRQTASLDAIKRGYADATNAAQQYLDMVSRVAAREISGAGMGNKARDFNAGLNAIEDRESSQLQELQRDNRNGKFQGREADYAREVELVRSTSASEIAIYRAKYATLNELQGDWRVGANEALKNYYDESMNVAKSTEHVFTDAFKGMEDGLVNFVTTGKFSFKSLTDSIIADLVRIQIKSQITGPLSQSMQDGGGLFGFVTGLLGLGGGGSPGAGFSSDAALLAAVGGRAIGGPVSANSMYRVNENGPELLEVAGNQYLMMGNQGGSVTPNDKLGGSTVNYSPTFVLQQPASRVTQDQVASRAMEGMRRAQRIT